MDKRLVLQWLEREGEILVKPNQGTIVLRVNVGVFSPTVIAHSSKVFLSLNSKLGYGAIKLVLLDQVISTIPQVEIIYEVHFSESKIEKGEINLELISFVISEISLIKRVFEEVSKEEEKVINSFQKAISEGIKRQQFNKEENKGEDSVPTKFNIEYLKETLNNIERERKEEEETDEDN